HIRHQQARLEVLEHRRIDLAPTHQSGQIARERCAAPVEARLQSREKSLRFVRLCHARPIVARRDRRGSRRCATLPAMSARRDRLAGDAAAGAARGAAGNAAGGAHRARGNRERQLRIIAGRWRGRRWRFPPTTLRPTPDRVRETLFNWLQGYTEGAHCLDLYAGSGALGLEALSRGAAAATFVEQERTVAQALAKLLTDWQAQHARVVQDGAQRFLQGAAPARAFDLVFLDPPFASMELSVVPRLLARGWLSPTARIYIEHARSAPLPALPGDWRELKTGTAGEVGYHLFAPAGGA